jgi:diguanylate cyclase (GGDEF)-like protein
MEVSMAHRSAEVLVIDDDLSVCELVGEALEGKGLAVVSAPNGTEGLRIAKRDRPDLVVLDVRMPGIDGIEFCRQLRRGFLTSTIPIIMMTSPSQPSDRIEGMRMGADDYVTKPLDPEELLVRVTAQLQRTERDIQTSPLTRLPGNPAVETALRERISSVQPFAVCYFDLDHFKPYNSKYGFLAGDLVIKQLSEIIVAAVLEHGNEEDFVGHEGGDDFVVITSPNKAQAICETVIEGFDEAIEAYHEDRDRDQGYFVSRDRQGNEITFPLLSVSGAVVSSVKRNLVHPRQIAQIAAEVLSYVKGLEGSNYLIDRRADREQISHQEV